MWLNTLMLDVERRSAFPQEPGGFMKMAVVRPKPSPSPSPTPTLALALAPTLALPLALTLTP